MKIHELMSELVKLDSNAEIYLDTRHGGVPITDVKIVPMNLPKKKDGIRSYPYGEGVKRCKSKGVVLTNKKWSE